VFKKDRRFGIEIEYDLTYEEFKPIALEAITKVYGPKSCYCRNDKFQSTYKTHLWHIKQENYSVAELTTPVSTLSDLPKISKVIRILNRNGIKGNGEDCGTHIHIDIPDIDKYHWSVFWLIYEKAIVSCFPKCRRENCYSEPIIDSKRKVRQIIPTLLDDCVAANGGIFRMDNYDKKKLIEIRLAEATTDANFLSAWVKFLVSYCDFIKKQNAYLACGEKCCSGDTEDLLEKMTLDQKSKAIMMNRYNKYRRVRYW
jgi:hypothetical protein